MTKSVPTIASLLRAHRPTGKSTGGFLSLCTCGAAVDDYDIHQQDVILTELFPHLATIHQDLITEPDSVFPKHLLYKSQLEEADHTLGTLRQWSDAHPRDKRYPSNQGYNLALQEVNHILDTGTLPDPEE